MRLIDADKLIKELDDYEADDWEKVMAAAIEALEKQRESMHLRVCENWYYCMYEREVQDDKRRSNK